MAPNDTTGSEARLTFLLSAETKKAFGALCAAQDLTVSQVLRRLIAEHLECAGYHPRHELAPRGSD
jgi:hypothetical protein